MTNMRQLGPLWVLSLLLVFVQQGAVLHEIGHLDRSAQVGGVTLQPGSGPAGNASCPICQAFSQFANFAFGAAQLRLLCPPSLVAAAEPRRTFRSAETPTPRSRGPPQV